MSSEAVEVGERPSEIPVRESWSGTAYAARSEFLLNVAGAGGRIRSTEGEGGDGDDIASSWVMGVLG